MTTIKWLLDLVVIQYGRGFLHFEVASNEELTGCHGCGDDVLLLVVVRRRRVWIDRL